MQMTLRNALKSAEDGYISDPKEVNKILVHLLGTQMKDIPPDTSRYIHDILSTTLEYLKKVDEKEFGNLSYLDILCMADSVYDIIIREEPDGADCLYVLLDVVFWQFFKDTKSYCTWTDLFRSVNVKALMDNFDDLAQESRHSFAELISITGRISDENYRYSITEKTTVEDLLNQTDRVIKRAWYPWKDINDYSKDIIVGYEVMNLITFVCIRKIYPTVFEQWKFHRKKT